MKHQNTINILALAICMATTSTMAQTAGKVESTAAQYLAAQVDSLNKKLYVYSDYSDSRNYFTQRGLMKSGDNVPTPQMNEAHETALSGTSAIQMQITLSPTQWAGYYFGNGIQNNGATPQFDWGDNSAGINLTGASKLVLHAKTTADEPTRINFFIGGNGSGKQYPDSDRKETGYVSLNQEWQKFEIPLEGADLSYLSGGFGWVTNFGALVNNTNTTETATVTILLDEIYYEFQEPRIAPTFPASYEAVPLNEDGYFINSVAYSYDLAVATLALSYAGKTEQALSIADGLLFALRHDRKFDLPERGLRNGYAAGNPSSFPGWTSAAGKAPFAKLTGFQDIVSQEWWEDYYSDSFSTGNNAWAILAFIEAYRISNNKDYLAAACDVADYIHTLRDNTNGGFKGGWEGFDDNQQQAGYISTEHCIDIFSAFTRLADELSALYSPDLKKVSLYQSDAAHARDFVVRMYDQEQGLFYTGTKPDGKTINRDVYPLDVNTWGLMAFYDDPAINQKQILATIENRFAVDGMYDFNDDRDGIWWEGSLQKIIAEKIAGNPEKAAEQLAVANAAAQPDGSITAADRDGVTTGIWLEGVGDDGQPKGNEWKYNKRVHTGATAWLAFAQLGVNPLDPRRSQTDINIHPAVTRARSYVLDGRLHVTGVSKNTPIRIYSVTGREIAHNGSSDGDTFSCPLPARGTYIVTAGTKNWKVVF
ncbi:MAG: hypothetical protein LBF79_00745 [Dysgonamonadaceae bacterium]|jgi:hypothetical protein|nr:hypothetical protein [Dysgonamonadaceae bacterium]